MKYVSAERFIEKLDCDVYPITIIKFLLNRRRIVTYFSKVAKGKYKINGTRYKMNHDDCSLCNSKKDQGILCRQHTSINRVMTADVVAYDLDTQTYIYKNEIYRNVDGKLVIFYCPHPSLITGSINDSKVRRINITTIDDDQFTGLPKYKQIYKFVSSELMDKHMKCWFNKDFSIVTLPVDRNKTDWCLIPNY